MTNQEASDAGKALGQQQDALITPQINSTTLGTHIPNAKANPTETQFFGGGKADNYLPGDNKRIACDTGTPNPDPYKQQTCNAINLVAKAPSQRPQIEVNRNDPILQREQATRKNATSIVGGAGISTNPNGLGIAGTYSDCTTTTTPDPSPPETKTCTEFLQSTQTTSTNTCQKSAATVQKCHQIMSFTVTQPEPVPATPNYSCPSGAILIGTECQPYAYAATVNYSCSAGSTLSGTQCQPAPTTATLSYSCVSGTLSGTQCVYPAISPTTTYSCPSGGTLSGTTCIGATINATVTYTCPSGSTLSGTTCNANKIAPTKTYSYCTPMTPNASCNGNGTVQIYGVTVSMDCGDPSYIYSSQYSAFIKNVVLNGKSVALYLGQYGCGAFTPTYGGTSLIGWSKPLYSCPSGYVLSGTNCYPSGVPISAPATATYSCPSGYTLSGTTCTKPNYAATATQTCPVNYSLSGSSCVTPSTAATASYSCPTNTTLSGTNCYPPPVGATVFYTCPSPDTVTGTNCQPPNTSATVTYSCGPGMTLSGSTCIPAPVVTETFTDNCATLQAKTQ